MLNRRSSSIVFCVPVMMLVFAVTLSAQERSSRSDEPLGKEISETQRSIHSLESELERQKEYLGDLYDVQTRRDQSRTEQSRQMDDLQGQITTLTKMLGELTGAVQTLADKDTVETTVTAEKPKKQALYTSRDSLALVELRRKEAESRRQIEAVTLEILELSERLKDPDRRYALAKKLKEQEANPSAVSSKTPARQIELESISARSIDMAAVELIRKGKSLDQARMMVIDGIDPEQMHLYYQALPREQRYELYDLADEIMAREKVDLSAARRSALYIHFYAP